MVVRRSSAENRQLSGKAADSGEFGELRHSRRDAAVGGSSGEARRNGGVRAAVVAAATAAVVCGDGGELELWRWRKARSRAAEQREAGSGGGLNRRGGIGWRGGGVKRRGGEEESAAGTARTPRWRRWHAGSGLLREVGDGAAGLGLAWPDWVFGRPSRRARKYFFFKKNFFY